MVKIKAKSFSLLEILIAAALTTIILAGVYTVLYAGNRSWRLGSSLISLQENARNAAYWLSKDIRQSTQEISNSSLSSINDTVSINAAAGQIDYLLSQSNNVKLLERSNLPVARYIENINITSTADMISINVIAQKNVPLKGLESFSIERRIKRRNE